VTVTETPIALDEDHHVHSTFSDGALGQDGENRPGGGTGKALVALAIVAVVILLRLFFLG
jgi:hypothetical protein